MLQALNMLSFPSLFMLTKAGLDEVIVEVSKPGSKKKLREKCKRSLLPQLRKQFLTHYMIKSELEHSMINFTKSQSLILAISIYFQHPRYFKFNLSVLAIKK